MGLNFLVSNCSCSCSSGEYPVVKHSIIPSSNPDPTNFTIEKSQQIHGHLVVQIYYPDCGNYEGRKILVYQNKTIRDLAKCSRLDPHFCDNADHLSPVARFEPTERGWQLAVHLCASRLMDTARNGI